MSAPTMARSAYPVPVQELVPRALELAESLGQVPSLNRLKAELRIGTDKARAVQAAVAGAVVDRLTMVQTPTVRDDATDTGRAAGQDDTSTAGHVNGHRPTPDTPETSNEDNNGGLVLESPLASTAEHTETGQDRPTPVGGQRMRSWPVWLLALPAFVAIWSGWVGLGELAGFGVVHPLPGIADSFSINTAITLPIGMETYAAYAIRVWLSGAVPERARRFAKWSAIGALGLGMLGQIAYHLMVATEGPWLVTTLVSCLPVAVFGMGAALAHLIRSSGEGRLA